jgi:hypothetical protein
MKDFKYNQVNCKKISFLLFPFDSSKKKYKIHSMSEEAFQANINAVKTQHSAIRKLRARSPVGRSTRKIKEAERLENAFGISLRVRMVDSDIEPINLDDAPPPKRDGCFFKAKKYWIIHSSCLVLWKRAARKAGDRYNSCV